MNLNKHCIYSPSDRQIEYGYIVNRRSREAPFFVISDRAKGRRLRLVLRSELGEISIVKLAESCSNGRESYRRPL